MNKFLISLTAAMLLCGATYSANALVLAYTVSANGGASFGQLNPMTFTSGLSSLDITPTSGILNVTTGPVDLDVDFQTVLRTTRPTNSATTDTIVAPFDFRIRVGDTAAGANTTNLGQPAPGVPFIEFSQVGQFTTSNIKEGSANSVFNTAPFGGNFGGTGTSSQTLFLAGVGDVKLSFKSFDFPGAPQFDPIMGDFRGFGGITDTLAAVPEPGSIAMLGGLLVSCSALVLRRRRK